MVRKYSDYMDSISQDELLEGLLGYGLFSERLPPIFTSAPFFRYCKKQLKSYEPLYKWTDYISFRVMRNVNYPRVMGIPNPFSYRDLCIILYNNWSKLRGYFHEKTDGQKYVVSRIHIRKELYSKCIFKMNYNNWYYEGNPKLDFLVHETGVSRYLVKADISTCFPGIYTHTIPWALVGKKTAKQSCRQNNPNNWYDQIDEACRNTTCGETHGILIGPHASNLISEIILTAIDKQMEGKGYLYIRNIDDYECYVDSYEKAQNFLTDLERTLAEFDLLLNHKKTQILELPIGMDKEWKYSLNFFKRLINSDNVTYKQVQNYIDIAIKLSKENNNDSAVINYSLKLLASMKMKLNVGAKKLAATRFLHLAVLNPYFLHLMEEYVFIPFDVDVQQIKLFADSIYEEAKKTNNFESICYAFYFAIRYDFELKECSKDYEIVQNDLFQRGDCLTLLFAWLYFMKQNHCKRDATQVKPFKKEAKLKSQIDMDRYWLFCYEVLSAEMLKDDWKKIKKEHISFIREDFLNIDKISANISNDRKTTGETSLCRFCRSLVGRYLKMKEK